MRRGRLVHPSRGLALGPARLLAMSKDLEPSSLDGPSTLRERDFYRKLLELGTQEDVEPLLADALSLIVALCEAQRGYLEIDDQRTSRPPAAGKSALPRFTIAHGFSDADVAAIRATFSEGVMSEAIATRKTVLTASALEDARFRERGSVIRNKIEAVLCAPIGIDPPLGVLYLQGRNARGPFTEEDRTRAEIFARQLAALTDRLLLRKLREGQSDPTERYRSMLRVAGIVGSSAAVAKLLSDVALVAPRDVTVLLVGASGTGKTQTARLIHDNSPRSSGPFLELNCAAMPESLLESELFGALPGAHSAASRRIPGKVAAAQRGTLFLDEVAELPLAAQAKLLQLLQSKQYFPLGGSSPIKADVRVIAASNTDLEAAVAQRKFREDLYFRIHVLPIRLPNLAERRDDIPELLAHFCRRASELQGLPTLRCSPGAVRAAVEAEWPGNIRQLENCVTAAAIRAAGEGSYQLERRHLFPCIAEEFTPSDPGKRLSYQEATRRFQEDLLRDVLRENRWNVSMAAEQLDLTRAHVYNLIRAFGLERE